MLRSALGATALTATIVATLGGCLSYSPHEIPSGPNRRIQNLRWLESRPEAPRLRFAVVGDVQNGFDEAEEVVDHLNDIEDLAFVVQVGDFTDLGLADEWELMIDVFDDLRVPWFVVIGNHDFLGVGERMFDALFGPRNSDFTYHRTRFVLLDSNSREYGFDGTVPDLAWLAERLAPGPDHDRAVVFSHVWPWSTDFDPDLVDPYLAVLRAAGVSLSLHGHDHKYRAEVRDGVTFVLADHVWNRSFLLVEEDDDGALVVQKVDF